MAKNWFKSTEIIDDYTIKINLNQVYTPFLVGLTQMYARIISPVAIKKYGMKLGNNPSGTGPWKFSEWVPGEKIILTRNSEYWRGKPRLDGIVFKFTPDITVRMMGFESNSFDVIDQPQYTEMERLEKSQKYVSHSVVSGAFFHYVFNCASGPLASETYSGILGQFLWGHGHGRNSRSLPMRLCLLWA